jgi:uncharacterized DUF497 family protein
MIEFKWDPAKAEGNLRKHAVTFEDAATVFADLLSETFDDPDHSDEALRLLIKVAANQVSQPTDF